MGKQRSKAPTRAQKTIMEAAGYTWRDYRVIWEDEECIQICRKLDGSVRTIKKAG